MFNLNNSRVSKTHGHMDACPHKIFYNLRKTLTLERKTGKTGTFFIFLVQFDKGLSNLQCFIALLVHNSAQNYIRQNSLRAKQFSFRRSD